MEAEDAAQQHRHRRDEGDALEDGTEQEGDRQQRVVPAGLDRAGKHHRRPRLQRHDEDHAEKRDDAIGLHPAQPMRGRSAPA